MVADDQPSNSELAWRLDRIQDTLTGLVGHPEYEADKRGADRRLSDLERDLAAERRERAQDIKAVHKRITDEQEAGASARENWRTRLWTGALPALVTLLGIVAAIWIATHGGSSHR